MSDTVFDRAVREAVDDGMMDPEFCRDYACILKRMRTGYYPTEILDSIFQKHRDGYDIYDAYAFGQVYAMIWSGEVVVTSITMKNYPDRDCEIESNNKMLSNLPRPFAGTFWGGKNDSDGYISWKDTIQATEFTDNENGDEFRRLIDVPKSQVPLEIGYTSAARTLAHVRMDHGVARWPYGSKEIRIMVNVKPVSHL